MTTATKTARKPRKKSRKMSKQPKTSISKGNIKLGKKNTWNVNLAPFYTCASRNMPCYKEGCCYNAKAWVMWPAVRQSWTNNVCHYMTNPEKYFDDIIGTIQRAKKPPKFFRWHAAGEIPDQAYFEGVKKVSGMFPEIKFLIFTKRYDLTFENLPDNLQLIISAWPGVEIPKDLQQRFPIAWMMDGREDREPTRKVHDCPNSCPECRVCWNLSKRNKDVSFHKH